MLRRWLSTSHLCAYTQQILPLNLMKASLPDCIQHLVFLFMSVWISEKQVI